MTEFKAGDKVRVKGKPVHLTADKWEPENFSHGEVVARENGSITTDWFVHDGTSDGTKTQVIFVRAEPKDGGDESYPLWYKVEDVVPYAEESEDFQVGDYIDYKKMADGRTRRVSGVGETKVLYRSSLSGEEWVARKDEVEKVAAPNPRANPKEGQIYKLAGSLYRVDMVTDDKVYLTYGSAEMKIAGDAAYKYTREQFKDETGAVLTEQS